jgi:hypothetical protein
VVVKKRKWGVSVKEPVTVLDYCVRVHGQTRGGLVAAHIAQWAIATHELGHMPTTVEYSEFWYVTERTGWLHRSQAREVFGDDWQRVVESVAADIGTRLSPRSVAGRPVPAFG